MLNVRQRAFAEHYVALGHQANAAKAAGYSGKWADSNAHKFMKNPQIREYIEELLKKVSSERIAAAEEVLETLTRILRREEKDTLVMRLKKRSSYYGEDGKKVTEEEETTELVQVPTPLREVNRAIELFMKRYKLLDDVTKEEDGEAGVVALAEVVGEAEE